MKKIYKNSYINTHKKFVYRLLKNIRSLIVSFADLAQLGERQTEDLQVPGSIPGVGIRFWLIFLEATVKDLFIFYF